MAGKTNVTKLALLVGTRKGAVTITGDAERERWDVGDLKCEGEDVFHLVYDGRMGDTLAAINSLVWGPEVRTSPDLGATWGSAERQPRFVGRDGRTVGKIWHIRPGRDQTPGVLFAGVDPAALFRSDDYGSTWQEVAGLTDHPTRDEWWGGLGGLCLHSIVLDPDNDARMWVGISAVGVLGTEDAGESWQLMNKGLRADYLPERFPELGQCPHKLLGDPSRPGTLVQQSHCGVFRSDCGGESWEDVSVGVAVSVRICAGSALARAGHLLRRAGGQGDGRRGDRRKRAIRHRRKVPCLPHPRRRQELGGADEGLATGTRLPARHARGHGHRLAGPVRHIRWHHGRADILQPRRRR